MAIWLPGYTRVDLGLHGKPFEYTHNPKGLLHATEGTSLAGAEQTMRAYPSHLGYDYRTREKHQYISLDLAAYSAMDQSDDDPIYQVELVGYAKDMRYLPDWALRNIAEDVIKPLRDTIGIPDVVIPVGFKDGLDGIYPYLASPESPIRLSYAGLRQFSGWLGHQHLPAPDYHWDPGAINMHRLLELAGPVNTISIGDEDMFVQKLDGDGAGSVALVSGGIVSGVSRAAAEETNRKAGGGILVGVTHAQWYDLVRKSTELESAPGLLRDVLAELKKLNNPEETL